MQTRRMQIEPQVKNCMRFFEGGWKQPKLEQETNCALPLLRPEQMVPLERFRRAEIISAVAAATTKRQQGSSNKQEWHTDTRRQSLSLSPCHHAFRLLFALLSASAVSFVVWQRLVASRSLAAVPYTWVCRYVSMLCTNRHKCAIWRTYRAFSLWSFFKFLLIFSICQFCQFASFFWHIFYSRWVLFIDFPINLH